MWVWLTDNVRGGVGDEAPELVRVVPVDDPAVGAFVECGADVCAELVPRSLAPIRAPVEGVERDERQIQDGGKLLAERGLRRSASSSKVPGTAGRATRTFPVPVPKCEWVVALLWSSKRNTYRCSLRFVRGSSQRRPQAKPAALLKSKFRTGLREDSGASTLGWRRHSLLRLDDDGGFNETARTIKTPCARIYSSAAPPQRVVVGVSLTVAAGPSWLDIPTSMWVRRFVVLRRMFAEIAQLGERQAESVPDGCKFCRSSVQVPQLVLFRSLFPLVSLIVRILWTCPVNDEVKNESRG